MQLDRGETREGESGGEGIQTARYYMYGRNAGRKGRGMVGGCKGGGVL
jgi:hypothetical protein